MNIRTIQPALLGMVVLLGAGSPACADRDGRGRPNWRPYSWHDQGSHNEGWHDGSRREQAWRERLWQKRHELRFYNPPVGVPPGYPYSYR